MFVVVRTRHPWIKGYVGIAGGDALRVMDLRWIIRYATLLHLERQRTLTTSGTTDLWKFEEDEEGINVKLSYKGHRKEAPEEMVVGCAVTGL